MTRVEQAAAKVEAAQAELEQARRHQTVLEAVAKAASKVLDERLALEQAQAELELELRAASEAGVALRPIAKAAGVSPEWARQLIAKT